MCTCSRTTSLGLHFHTETYQITNKPLSTILNKNMDAKRANPSDCPSTTVERKATPKSEASRVLTLPRRPSHKKQHSTFTPDRHRSAMVKADVGAALPQHGDTDAMKLCGNGSSYSLSASKSPHQASVGTTGSLPIRNAKPIQASNSFGQDEKYRPRQLSTPMEACSGSCRNNTSFDSMACTHGNKNKGPTDTSVRGTGYMMGMGSWCPEAKEIKIKRSLSGDSALFDMIRDLKT